MRSALRRALLVMVLPLTLAACGLDSDESDAADSLAAALSVRDAPESAQDSAECVADKWVGQVGTDPLVADGVLNEELDTRRQFLARVQAGNETVSEEVADAYAAAWISCADFDAIALDREAETGASAEELDEYADCLKEIDDDQWRQAIADNWAGQPRSSAAAGQDRDEAECEKQLK